MKFRFIFSDFKQTVSIPKKRKPTQKHHEAKMTLVYDKADYPSVKEKLQAFVDEQNLGKKMEYLADALNIGSQNTELDELVFLLKILWNYPWNKS